MLRIAAVALSAGCAAGAGVLAPTTADAALTCMGSASRRSNNATAALDWKPTDSQPWDDKACVPSFCVEKWCDECNSKSRGYKLHAQCTEHPMDKTKTHCELVNEDTLTVRPENSFPDITKHHCVHQNCLVGPCDKCHPNSAGMKHLK